MKKFRIFILMAVVLMAICFGCGNPDDTGGDTTADTYSRTWKRENYTIVLPNGVTAPEGNVASMFTWVEDGEYLVLALSPDVPESDGEETEHYLFPQGDQLYDLFFQPTRIPADKQEILLDSFTLSSQSEKTQEVQ